MNLQTLFDYQESRSDLFLMHLTRVRRRPDTGKLRPFESNTPELTAADVSNKDVEKWRSEER